MFENKALKKLFEPQRDKAIKDIRKSNNKNHYDLHLLTNPRCGVLLRSEYFLSEQITAIYIAPKFKTLFTKVSHRSLFRAKSMQSRYSSYFLLNINLNIILPSMPMSSEGYIFFRSSDLNLVEEVASLQGLQRVKIGIYIYIKILF
jgi:hypothetical protein